MWWQCNGVKGSLIWVMDGLHSRYMFRVYDDNFNFNDYELRHSDLQITIDDKDAYLYIAEDGTCILDHSPQTLGKE